MKREKSESLTKRGENRKEYTGPRKFSEEKITGNETLRTAEKHEGEKDDKAGHVPGNAVRKKDFELGEKEQDGSAIEK